MKIVNRRRMNDESGHNIWRSYSDMMSGLLLLFVLRCAVCDAFGYLIAVFIDMLFIQLPVSVIGQRIERDRAAVAVCVVIGIFLFSVPQFKVCVLALVMERHTNQLAVCGILTSFLTYIAVYIGFITSGIGTVFVVKKDP